MGRFLASLLVFSSVIAVNVALADSKTECISSLKTKVRELGVMGTQTKEAQEASKVLSLVYKLDSDILAARKFIWANHGILPSADQLKTAIDEVMEEGTFCTPEMNIQDKVVHEYQQYDTAIITLVDHIIATGVDTEETWDCTARVKGKYGTGKVNLGGHGETREQAVDLFSKACKQSAQDPSECIALTRSEKKNACSTTGVDPE